MIVNREKIVSLLVEKTGRGREETEAQLSALIARIRGVAEEGRAFKVEGFGTFDVQQGDLVFTPSQRLETEINNKYAGMKPIELIGAFKEPDTGEILSPADDVQTGDVLAYDEKAADEKTSGDEQEKESSAEAGKTEEPLPESAVEQSAGAAEDKPEKPEKAPSLAEEKPETGKSQPTKEAAPVEPSRKGDDGETKEDDPIGRVLLIIILVIAAAVAGWLIYDLVIDTGEDTISSPQSLIEQPARPSQASAQQAGDTRIPTEEQGQPPSRKTGTVAHPARNDLGNEETSEPDNQLQVKEQGTPSDVSKEQVAYGLRGEINKNLSGAYVIVVHSRKVLTKAEEHRDELTDDGFRVLIRKANVNGTIFYRVGIGQFKTVSAAQEAMKKLPEPYKSNNFIKRIN